MNSVGLRVKSKGIVYYSVASIDDAGTILLVIVDRIVVPVSLEMHLQFSFVRQTILDVFAEYNIENGFVRIAEFSRSHNKSKSDRLMLEGVVLESMGSGILENASTGRIGTICRLLQIETAVFRAYIEGQSNPDSLSNVGSSSWDKYSEVEREAILSAMAALNL